MVISGTRPARIRLEVAAVAVALADLAVDADFLLLARPESMISPSRITNAPPSARPRAGASGS